MPMDHEQHESGDEGDYCKDSVFGSPHVNDLAKPHDNCTPPSEFVIDVHQKAQNGSIIPRPKGKGR